MERERKGRTRPQHGLRPLLVKLGLVTITKSGAVKVAWREIGITALLIAILTVLLLPRLQLQARTLALGDIAPVDIKAPSDFLIEDEVSSQKKRREAEDRVLPVYDFDLQAAAAIDHRLKRAMQAIEAAYRVRPPELSGTLRDARSTTVTPEDAARMKGLEGLQTGVSREFASASPFFREREQEFARVLGIEVGEDTQAVLRRFHYDPQIRQAISQVVSSVMQRGIVSNQELFVGHRERGIVLRDFRAEQELIFTDTSAILGMSEAAAAVTGLAANLGFPPEVQQAVAAIARQLLQPNLTFNRKETEERKKRAVEAIKPVFFQVKQGEMIIREGERVREEHIPRLKALAMGKRRGDPVSAVAGTAIFVTFAVILGLLYMRQFRPKVPWDSQALLLLA
ncbi:MAG TPA: hypothetical protein VHN13_01575, partial [Candidatus Tectomicrobia bacterium]|nr:hypothetical protein [Candidatus Tectomicrobia bacterium]